MGHGLRRALGGGGGGRPPHPPRGGRGGGGAVAGPRAVAIVTTAPAGSTVRAFGSIGTPSNRIAFGGPLSPPRKPSGEWWMRSVMTETMPGRSAQLDHRLDAEPAAEPPGALRART